MTVLSGAGSLAFVTGGTGFIGGRLARALHARGYRLRCLVRSSSRAAELSALGAELVVGDIADAGALRQGLSGAETAWHAAGRYDLGVVDRQALEHVNVTGTAAFLDALRQSAVRRAVYISTVMALGPAAGAEGSEEDEHPGPFRTDYERTKIAAHRLAKEAQREGLPLIVVCPALVYGPGDLGPSGRIIEDVLRHRLPGLSRRVAWFSFVHVDDVVDGMIAAVERGQVGATYVLSGEHAPVDRFVRRTAEIGGTWLSPLKFPPLLVRATGAVMDAVTRLTGVRMPISRELADLAGTGLRWVHSHARATRELGYSPRSLEQGLPDAVRWTQLRISSGRTDRAET